jgi:predicted phosphodiesterase
VIRIAIVSDIHGNRTAFEAVLAGLRQTSPDLVLHGGDLADVGASPTEIVDRIRDLGWRGVIGNGEEALSMPETLEEFARQSSAPPFLWAAIGEVMAETRALLGEERIGWLRGLPRVHIQGSIAVVHASPESRWGSPGPEASDAELESVYGSLGQPMAIFGHIHRPFIRSVPCPQSEMLVANTGSVSLSYDGDLRAAYLLLDGSKATIRRVEYDVERELKALSTCSLPHRDWIAQTLRSASPQMPYAEGRG